MKKRNSSTSTKPKVELTPLVFKKIVAIILSDDYLTKTFTKKLDQFFSKVDVTIYEQDADLYPYYRLISEFVNKSIHESINDTEVILDYISELPGFEDDFEMVINEACDTTITKEVALHIENEIGSQTNYVMINEHIAELEKHIEKIKKKNYKNLDTAVEEFKSSANNAIKNLVPKNTNALSTPDLYFNDSLFKDHINKIRKRLNDTKRYIKTGIKRLNHMLNGGFQPGRVYVFLGITGGWKSGILLNSIFWATKYNTDVTCNDTVRRPVALYLT